MIQIEAWAKGNDLICRITQPVLKDILQRLSISRSSQKLIGVKEVFVDMIQAIRCAFLTAFQSSDGQFQTHALAIGRGHRRERGQRGCEGLL